MDKKAPKIQTDKDSFDDNLFPELQELWDWHDDRIAAIVARPEAQPCRLDPRHATTHRRHVMTGYLLLAIANVATAIYATTLLGHPYSRVHAAGLILMAICGFIALHCLCTFVELQRHHPVRIRPFHRHGSSRVVQTAFSSIGQMATACVVTVIALLVVAHFPIGDGYMMSSSNRAERAMTIEKIETTLARI